MTSKIYFHIATIGNYQEIFDEIYLKIFESNLIDVVDEVNLCIVGDKKLNIIEHEKIKLHRHLDETIGEFFTLDKIKSFSDLCEDNYKILYIHTKGVTTPNNSCIVDWRKYMTYFNVEGHFECLNFLNQFDSCGVDLVSEPTIHYSGNFWWANSSYIKQLPTIDEIKFPKILPILSIRHNCEFWIGMGNGNHKSIWNSNINVYERHLHKYPDNLYKVKKCL
jgi:hypothetical protein